MRWYLQLLGLAMVVSLFYSCQKENIDTDFNEINQEVLFQFEFVNHAWGYHHRGWLIDSSGNVYCYDAPENWNFGDSEGIITESEMSSNLQATSSVCTNVSTEVLLSRFQLIDGASKGELSDPVNEMYDAGVSAYFGFVYDPDKQVYTRVLLKQTGDFAISNTSREAILLYHWLNQVDEETRQ